MVASAAHSKLRVSNVGAQIHCARTRTAHTRFCSATITFYARMYFLAGGHHTPTRQSHPCILAGGHRTSHLPTHALAGGHRSSVELRPSRNPSLKSSETMPSWGITPTHSHGTSEMCRLCCDLFLLLFSIPMCRLCCDFTPIHGLHCHSPCR
jgi:hypothetical protein